MKIKDLPFGILTKTACLVLGVDEKPTKTGKKYSVLTISDGETKIQAKFWDGGLEKTEMFNEHLVECSLKKGDYNGNDSYEISNVLFADPGKYNINDFIMHPPIPCEEMFNDTLKILKKAKPLKEYEEGVKPIREIAIKLLKENKEQILGWSAAKGMHHSFRGGLLYHTYRMVKTAYLVADIYDLDQELLVCGAALHDFGKLKELDTDWLGNTTYTLDGRLFGHLYIGARAVEEEAKRGVYDDKKVQLLMHLIASHHGTPEFGAIQRPLIPEAVALNKIDDLDAKLEMFREVYEGIEPEEFSGDFNKGLDIYPYRWI